jgi:hypothetical protein
MAQKHAGNVIVEDIFKFNFYCMMLAMLPLLLKKGWCFQKYAEIK